MTSAEMKSSSNGRKGPGTNLEDRRPDIPDHEIIRLIGSGSYGEVWLARSVTGAFRAVKIVRREDFKTDKSFEREFRGIQHFEPVSRSHPGLVDILHIGRPCPEYYYYVMELADDVKNGQAIVPDDYEPQMLNHTQEMTFSERIDHTINVGIQIAEALQSLHDRKLTHRDVKPSNIIFVDGGPKLADIGLVAAQGQRTYVGTEGFVPPEGPGAPAADIFSLGMLLYEYSTGKDRLDFPELPNDMGSEADRERWVPLNTVICKACSQDPKHRFATAGKMSEALKNVQVGKKNRFLLPTIILLAASIALFIAGSIAWANKQKPSTATGTGTIATTGAPAAIPEIAQLPEVTTGTIELKTTPEGAEVIENENVIGETPMTIADRPAGMYTFQFKLDGYQPKTIRGDLKPGDTVLEGGNLDVWSPPQNNLPWKNSIGLTFRPLGEDHHQSYFPVQRIHFDQFVNATGNRRFNDQISERAYSEVKPEIGDTTTPVVAVPPEAAEAFCDWLTEKELGSYLPDDKAYENVFYGRYAGRPSGPENIYLFHLLVKKQDFGSVSISTPGIEGAEVHLEGKMIGKTPLHIARVKVEDQVEFEIRKEGYKTETRAGEVEADKHLPITVNLEKNPDGVNFTKPWSNALGIEFLPMGDIMVAVTETTVEDYQFYLQDYFKDYPGNSGSSDMHDTPFRQLPNHPVTNISRDDAAHFCDWLTLRERQFGYIEQHHEYRLPSDEEWSQLAGLLAETGETPEERDRKNTDTFPWEGSWENGPPTLAGNFADISSVSNQKTNIIADYNDSHPYTSPVKSYKSNNNGFYDVGGNVWEWVSDSFGGDQEPFSKWGVLRGGAWDTYQKEHLLASYRKTISPESRSPSYGFRVVLAQKNAER